MNQSALDFQALIASIQNLIDGIFRQLTHRCLQRSFIAFKQRFQLPKYHYVLVFPQRSHGPFIYRKRAVWNYLVHINQVDISQSLTPRASPLRRVEREVMRCRLLVRKSRHRTHQAFAVMTHTFRLCIQYHQQSVTLLHSCSYALLQPAFFLFRDHYLVNHHLYVMILVTVQLHAVYDFLHFSIYTYIEIALLTYLLEQFLVMSFTRTHQRCQDINAFSFIITVYQIQNLFFGIFHHLLTRKIGISRTCTGKQQSQIIINLRGCSHSRTRILVRRLLFDGNHRTQSRNLVHIRPFHPSQKVTGIGRKSLNITALSFHKQRIKCQRRLSASAQSGNHRQAVTRDFHIYIFQVVYPSSLYTNRFCSFSHTLSINDIFAKIVKGENRDKRKTKFSDLAMPSRILSSRIKDRDIYFSIFIRQCNFFCTFATQQIHNNHEILSDSLPFAGFDFRKRRNNYLRTERKQLFSTYSKQRTESLLHCKHVPCVH